MATWQSAKTIAHYCMAVILRIAILILTSPVVFAGMPMITFSDFWDMRLKSISFFAFALLVCSFLFKLLWNYIRRDFAVLPYLTYRRSIAMIVVLGLLFMVVLTMISGARELMTPGAWTKQGLTYRVATGPESEQQREQRLMTLKKALWQYADAHNKAFPAHDLSAEIANESWFADSGGEVRYRYIGGLVRVEKPLVLAYEPRAINGTRWVLFTNGLLQNCTDSELINALRTSH